MQSKTKIRKPWSLNLANAAQRGCRTLLLAGAALALACQSTARADVAVQEIGAAPPTVGPNDIAQLNRSTSFPPTKPDSLNYYWDNGNPPGQTFTTGSNPGGYSLTSLAVQTAGNGGGGYDSSNPYALRIYSVSGSTATSIATYTTPGFALSAQGDWVQWTGLSTYLAPNTQYAYSFGRTGGAGWEAMACSSDNPYAGGEIVLIPPAGGTMTFGSSHSWDAAFVAGLSTAALPPTLTKAPASAALYAGRPAVFSATLGGTPPFTYQWQKNGVTLSDGGRISGATTATLVVSNITSADAGTYTLVAANSASSVSASATLTVLPAPTPGSFAESVLTNQPLAYWRFGETSGTVASDNASGLDGTYLDAAMLGQTGAQPPDFLGFDSSNLGFQTAGSANAWATIPPLNLKTNTVTFVAWIYPYYDQSGWTGIIMTRDGTQAGFNFSGTANELAYTWNNNTTWQYHSGLVVSNATWSMVALVVTPTNATFYVGDTNSGIRSAVITLNNNAEVWGGTGLIGDDQSSTGRAFNGIIDEAAAFSHSLSREAITALYAAGRAAGVLAPSISQSPVPQQLYPGRTAQFSVVASGTSPNYRWRKDGVSLSDGGRISGSTSATLTISNAQAGDAGRYDVVVSNSAGSATSDAASLALVSPTGSAYEAAVIATAPTAYWRLSESSGATNAFDYYGGNTANYGSSIWLGQSGPVTTDFTGFENNNTAPQFTSLSPGSWVTVPPLNLNTNTVTITAWINPANQQSGNAAIVYQRQGLTVAGLTYTGSGLTLGYNWDNSATAYNWDSGLTVPLNQWSFVALVVEPDKATIYLYNKSGVATAAHTMSHVNQPFAGTTYIGNDINDATGARIFSGLIDEVAIWNRSLTGEQVAALYAAASGTSVAPTVALQPVPQTTYAGLNAQFTASAAGSATLNYRWLKNGAPLSDSGSLSGTATPTLTITGATLADAGNYSLSVQNASGSVTSHAATLTVLPNSARIAWSAPVPITTAENALVQPGTVAGAAVFGGTESIVTLAGGLTLDFKADGSVASATGNGTGTGALGLFSTKNASFDVALGQFSSDGGPKTITLTNLIPGHQYSVQLFGLDDRDSTVGSRRACYRDPFDTNDVSATFYMTNNVFVIGTFTAVSNSQSIIEVLPGYDDGVTQVGNGNINALVVRDTSSTPTISGQPGSITRLAGATAVLNAVGYGTPPLGYFWQKGHAGTFANLPAGGTISAGVATPISLTLPAVSAADAADYRLVLTNASGSVTSQVATLTVLAPASGSYAAAAVSYSPLAYWQLNESSGTIAHDYVGGFDGTYGSAAILGVAGVPNPPGNLALQTTLGTTNSWAVVPTLNLNSSSATFTAWIRPTGSQANWSGIFMTRAGGTSAGIGYNDQSMLAYTWNGDSTWSFASGLVIPADEWSFVAVAISPTNAALYLINANGVQTTNNAVPHQAEVWSGVANIGNDPQDASANRTFNGVVDEVAVFNRTLTAAEIQNLYSAVPYVSPNVKLTIQQVGTSVQLSWPSGTLLEADSLTGPWTTNTTTSPYQLTPTGARKFYRIRVQ